MAHIEVSDKTLAEFNRLLAELHIIYPTQKLSNDQIMEAMVGGFFDSLAYMQKQTEAQHGHHHAHKEEGCCGGDDDCENKKDGACCGGHHHH
ncbi:hypothetical protein P148_SR1C00001G0226 [candidate division SR1 bacterium RAAC1_SR1_1]|nr:hypothetical protein P148_SR1C00001G0226 [candidate division SR1 bacterium RAAC1_SR1_1]